MLITDRAVIAKSSVYKAAVLTVLAHLVQHPSWGNMNFSRTTTGMTKWFWVTMEGYLSYILPKFEVLVPTKKGLSIFTCGEAYRSRRAFYSSWSSASPKP